MNVANKSQKICEEDKLLKATNSWPDIVPTWFSSVTCSVACRQQRSYCCILSLLPTLWNGRIPQNHYFNLLLIAVQGFRTQMNKKNILHCNSLQCFLIVKYYARYTERAKPGADGSVLEIFWKVNKRVGWLKVKSQLLPSISKELKKCQGCSV